MKETFHQHTEHAASSLTLLLLPIAEVPAFQILRIYIIEAVSSSGICMYHWYR